MHSDIARGLAMLESVKQFRADHPLEPENERAEELFAEVSSAVDDLRSMGGNQDFNRRKVSGTSSERQQIAEFSCINEVRRLQQSFIAAAQASSF